MKIIKNNCYKYKYMYVLALVFANIKAHSFRITLITQQENIKSPVTKGLFSHKGINLLLREIAKGKD